MPDDRELVPFAHAFGSRLYDRDELPEPAIGERYAPVPWRGGKPPQVVADGGLCGSEEQWRIGALIDDPLPPAWPGTNIPRCCNPPPEAAAGGVALGAKLVQHPCCFGAEARPVVYVEIVHTAGFCDLADGTWPAFWDDQLLYWRAVHKLPSGIEFDLRVYCIDDELDRHVGLIISSNGALGGGTGFATSCEPFDWGPFLCDGGEPLFGCPAPGWQADVRITD